MVVNIYKHKKVYLPPKNLCVGNYNQATFILLVCTCCIFATIFLTNPISKYLYIESIDNRLTNQAIGEIYSGDVISQTFVSYTKFDGISINFSNYNILNSNKVNVTLLNITDNVKVEEWRVDGSSLSDNIKLHFDLEKDEGGNKKTYAINISIACEDENCSFPITIWSADADVYDDGALYFNDLPQENDITFSVYKKFYNLIGIITEILLFFIVIFFVILMNHSLETIAFFLTFFLGSCYLLAFGPYTEPDADYHYLSAYKLSNIILEIKDVNLIEEEHFDMDNFIVQYNTDTGLVRVMDEFNLTTEAANKNYVEIQKANNLNHPILYLVPAMGISLGRIMRFNFVKIYYLGRIFNLLFYSFSIYFIVGIVPKFKCVFLLCSLLPMALQQAVSYSYDTVIIILSMLFVAEILKLIYYVGEIHKKDILISFLTLLLLSPCKIVYSLLGGLFYLIPKNKFVTKKKPYLCISGLIITSIMETIFIGFSDIRNVYLRKGFYLGKSVYTLKDLLFKPLFALFVFINSTINSGWSYIQGMLGDGLAGGTVVLSNHFSVLFLLLILYASFSHKNDLPPLKRYQKAIIGIIVFLVIFVIFVPFYLSTQLGQTVIRGIQGRYFLPILIPVLLLFNSNSTIRKIKDNTLIFVMVLLQIGVVNELLTKIWD